MASLVTLILICIVLTIYQAAAIADDNIISNQSQGKNLTELTMKQISLAIPYFSDNGEMRGMINSSTNADNKQLALSALQSCQELLPLAMDNLNRSLSEDVTIDGMLSQICAAGTALQTCVDGFEDQPRVMFESVYNKLKYPIDLNRGSTKFMANSITSKVLKEDSEYPVWVSDGDMNLLQEDSKISANVVVAKDGSGKYKTISEAIKEVPIKSKTRFVIYVKSGVYNEHVRIEFDRWNVMMIGDGMGKTLILGNLSKAAGYEIWQSPTFAVYGEGFIARDVKFANTAGPQGQQAVALLSASDRSVFYRCSFNGYQDTLYAVSHRQFYRECQIYGTIDFIFGDAAMVVQKSSIFVRKPLQGQYNAITASGKVNKNCKSGIVVQASTIQASGDLRGVSTFLGRPWQPYATVVFMKNLMNISIHPQGWAPWKKAEPTRPFTVFLAEDDNKGVGAGIGGRVGWKGVWRNLTDAVATTFTVGPFIEGKYWLPPTQVPFDLGL